MNNSQILKPIFYHHLHVEKWDILSREFISYREVNTRLCKKHGWFVAQAISYPCSAQSQFRAYVLGDTTPTCRTKYCPIKWQTPLVHAGREYGCECSSCGKKIGIVAQYDDAYRRGDARECFRLAAMIRDMPLRDDVEDMYRVISSVW